MIFSQERQPQGAMIAVAPMPHVESVSVGFWLGVGGRHESKRQNGIFHFLEHMMFKGTTRRSARQISEEVEGVGGYLNAFTAEEMTCYYARASATHLHSVVDVLTDMLLHATFPAAEIERERGVIQEEIRMYEDQPGQVAQEAATALLFPTNPLGRPLAGTSEGVGRMRRRDLLNYRRKFYHSGNLFVTVAGKTDLPEVRDLLKPLLKRFPAGNRSPYSPGIRPADRALASISSASRSSRRSSSSRCAGCPLHDPRRSAFRLMSVILGENMSSRLFQVVREEHGLAYSISTGANYYQETGSFFINAGVENSKVEQAIRLTLQTVRKLARPRAQRQGTAPRQGIHLRPDPPEPGKHRQPDDVDGRGPHRPRPGNQSRKTHPPDRGGHARRKCAPPPPCSSTTSAINLAVVSPTAEQEEIERAARF